MGKSKQRKPHRLKICKRVLVLLGMIILRCGTGYMPMDAHGMNRLVLRWLKVLISACCSGHTLLAAHVVDTPVPMLLRVDILRF